MSSAIHPLSFSALQSALDWCAGAIDGTNESVIPPELNPAEVASVLRDSCSVAGYACVEREGVWYVVEMPNEPAKTSEPSVWEVNIEFTLSACPELRAECTVYGPNREYLSQMTSNLIRLFPPFVMRVMTRGIQPVDFGPDDDGRSASWEDNGDNEVLVIECVGHIMTHARRLYPYGVPDNAQLAKLLAAVFSVDRG